ncbi:MAG TPA: thiamine diphosphokinase [Candidatus Saccharimonadales bacterium]|nr:thiamine diphosphokinase [Candidatus Saccharimonadales bacterium]
MFKNKAVIFLNGDKSDYSHISDYIDKDTLLIACDGGAIRMKKLGYEPQAVVGDFDSLDRGEMDDAEIVEHPADKDYTDSEAAVRYATGKGAKEVILTGLSGSRIDHMLGNIYLLDKKDFSDIDLKIIEGRQEIYMIKGDTTIKGKKGDIISFLPIRGDVRAISSSGLKYNLADYVLSLQGNSGISNEMTEAEARVFLKKEDTLLVMHELEP